MASLIPSLTLSPKSRCLACNVFWLLLVFAPRDFLRKSGSKLVQSPLEAEGRYFWQPIWQKFLGPPFSGIDYS